MTEETPVQSPGSFVAAELERRGWSQRELAEIIGRPYQLVNEIVKGKRAITIDTAVALGAAFGENPEAWMQREAAYQLAQSSVNTDDVHRRAHLYNLAPIKEMDAAVGSGRQRPPPNWKQSLRDFSGSTLSTQSLGSVPLRESPMQKNRCLRANALGASASVRQPTAWPPLHTIRVD